MPNPKPDKWDQYVAPASTSTTLSTSDVKGVVSGDKWDQFAEQAPATPVKSPNLTRASRRNQQAQPTISPSQRANDPVNQDVSTALATTPYVAGAVLTGAGIASAPLATVTGLAGAYAGGPAAKAVTRRFTDDEDIQNLAEWGGTVAGGLAGTFGGSKVTIPSEINLPFGMKFQTPEWMASPKPYQPSERYVPKKSVFDRFTPSADPAKLARGGTGSRSFNSPKYSTSGGGRGNSSLYQPGGFGDVSVDPGVITVPENGPNIPRQWESVRGPGNPDGPDQLTPLAKTGARGGPEELQRRGWRVLYQPNHIGRK